MTYSPTLLAAVAVLDQDVPGWHRKMNPGELDLNSHCHCAVGQALDCAKDHDFYGHMMRLFGVCKAPVDVRGDVPVGYPAFWPEGLSGFDYTPQWRSLVAERQAADTFVHDTLAVNDDRVDTIEGVPV